MDIKIFEKKVDPNGSAETSRVWILTTWLWLPPIATIPTAACLKTILAIIAKSSVMQTSLHHSTSGLYT